MSSHTRGGAKRKNKVKRGYAKRAYTKRGAGAIGRPKGIVARLGLRDLGIEQLSMVIDAARDEARRKIAQLAETFSS
jgi:hypothetical protein